MILEGRASHEVVTSEDFQVFDYGVGSRDQVVMFDILRNKLYSHKIKAVVREYLTNAADACIEAGRDPSCIEISLPSTHHRWYSIRDYGPGLSEDRLSIFTTYFSSTKRTSNAFNGMLGLGCKAGFAYADTFHIVNHYQGKRTVYAASVANTVQGECTRISESPCDPSDTGIEIRLEVSGNDINAFLNTVEEVLFFATFKPKVLNNTRKPQEYYPVAQGPTWALYGNHVLPHTLSQTRVWVQMSNVGYPVDLSRCGLNAADNSWFQSHGAGLVLKAPNGSVQFTPNRETLEYTPAVVAWLKAALHQTKTELLSGLQTCLDAAQINSRWRAAANMLESMTSPPFITINGKFKYEGGYFNLPSDQWKAYAASFRDAELHGIGTRDFDGVSCHKVYHSAFKCLKSDFDSIEAVYNEQNKFPNGLAAGFVRAEDAQICVTDNIELFESLPLPNLVTSSFKTDLRYFNAYKKNRLVAVRTKKLDNYVWVDGETVSDVHQLLNQVVELKLTILVCENPDDYKYVRANKIPNWKSYLYRKVQRWLAETHRRYAEFSVEDIFTMAAQQTHHIPSEHEELYKLLGHKVALKEAAKLESLLEHIRNGPPVKILRCYHLKPHKTTPVTRLYQSVRSEFPMLDQLNSNYSRYHYREGELEKLVRMMREDPFFALKARKRLSLGEEVTPTPALELIPALS